MTLTALAPLWDSYLATLTARRLSRSYLVSHQTAYTRLCQVADPSIDVEHLDLPFMRSWVESLSDLSASTIRLYVKHVKGFLFWCWQEEWIETNPNAWFGRLRLPRGITKATPLPAAESLRLLARAAHFGTRPVRDTALILTMIAAGGRVMEVVHLTWDDVNLEAGSITDPDGHPHPFGILLLHGKGSKDRFVPIEEEAVSALRLWGEKGRVGSVFGIGDQAIRERLNVLCKDAGIAHIAPHQLRVAFSTAGLAEHPDSLRVMQQWMGHSHQAQTEHYARMVRAATPLPGKGPLAHYDIRAAI